MHAFYQRFLFVVFYPFPSQNEFLFFVIPHSDVASPPSPSTPFLVQCFYIPFNKIRHVTKRDKKKVPVKNPKKL